MTPSLAHGDPLFDIVIPSYNHGRFITTCLDSVIRQTFPNWKCWIIDNYSDDETDSIVSQFSDSRITYAKFQNHGIIGASRNHGASLGSAKFIAFLDSDDWWDNNKLAHVLAVTNAECDAVCHDEYWVNSTGKHRYVKYGPGKSDLRKFLNTRGNCLSTSAVVVKRTVFEQHDGFSTNPDFVTAEDFDLWLRLVNANRQICFLNEPLGFFRMHERNSSNNLETNHAACLSVIKENTTMIPDNPQSHNGMRKLFSFQYYGYGRSLQKHGLIQKSFRAFLTSLRWYPLNFRSAVGIALEIAYFFKTRNLPKR
jgi:glycosyltransferase involved in cell wall biosynthesis